MKNNDLILNVENFPKVNQKNDQNLFESFDIFSRLENICRERNLFSLSACQIGVPSSLFVFRRENKFDYFFDCDYVGIGQTIQSIEQCSSIFGDSGNYRTFEVSRFFEVDISGKLLDICREPNSSGLISKEVNFRESGRNAVIFQHEIDHCKNISISQIGKEINLFYD